MGKWKFWTYENKLVMLFFFSIGFVFFDRLAINYLIPFIQEDFTLTSTQIGLIGSALALTWSIAGPLGGYLSDKVPSKKALLALFILGFSAVSLMHGLVGSFAMLFVLRLVMGLMEGPITPITQSVLAVESSEKRRGFNMGLTMNTGNAVFGSFLAPLLIVALANTFDWRTAFYLTIIPGIVLAVCIMKMMKNPQENEDKTISPTTANKGAGLKEVLKHRNIWLSVIIFSCFMVYLMAFQIFAPVFLVNVKSFSSSSMSIIMAAFGAGFAIFGMLIPAISDHFGRKPIMIIFGFVAAFVPLTIIHADSVVWAVILVFLFSSSMGIGSIVMSVIPTESVPVKYAGVAVGLTIGIGEFFGGFLNPMLSGIAGDVLGPQAPLWISASGAFLVFLLSFFLTETGPAKMQVNEGIEKVV
ncbi:Sugar phosphate permease [Alteribacillus persepolensis]|uniref:Sugar phosphate permease n=1 Tax=Alteribacillus persepolensis TaxID=568899 RepID=A0A1G8DSJ0_9BACI|nr:MFS transporter [Alteribacillus persepolensis]SDH60666.1 Sugar phosphate permease [Alteribacillus persepolensis]